MAMLLTTGIPITILAGIILFQISQTIQKDAEQAQSRIAQDMRSRIEEYNQDLYDTSYRVYYNFDLLESLRNHSDYQPDNSRNYDALRDTRDLFWSMYYNSRLKDILGIYIVNSDGVSAGSFFSYVPVNFSGLDPGYLKSLMKAMDKSGQQGPLIRYLSKSFYSQAVYQYITPLNYRGERVGLLVIDVKGASFQQMVEAYNTFYRGQVIISDSAGQIVYHTDTAQISSAVTEKKLSKNSMMVTADLDKYGWKLQYLYAINPSLLFFRNVAVAVIALAVLLMLGFSFALSYSITKPITLLHRNMAKIQLGDYTARTEVLTQDEIGFLGNQFNRMAERIEELVEHDFKLQLLNKETQIKALQAQISPHFLHNTLQTMSSMAMIENAPEIKLLCQCLSNMYRYNMNIEEEWVTLKDELRHIRNYLFIIKKRYPDLLNIRMRFGEDVQDMRIPKLIFQPIVENAIEHGLIPSRRSKKILKVSVGQDRGERKLRIVIADNGAGMSKEALRQSETELLESETLENRAQETRRSIGLRNVHSRIQLLCGKEYGLRMLSKPGKGTVVIIELPLEEGTST
jgi:sensor histidine kinase YesM